MKKEQIRHQLLSSPEVMEALVRQLDRDSRELSCKAKILREALHFYADPDNYDGGFRARQALDDYYGA